MKMFDISDMAKVAFDPILSTPLQNAKKGECNSTLLVLKEKDN